MKKRVVSLVLVVVLVFALASTVSAVANTINAQITYRNIKITVDGSAITPKDATGKTVEPFIMNGTTYLPIRAVAEALGLDVKWDSATNTVGLSGGAADTDSVYITRTGSKYHLDGSCNGGTYWPVPYETATGMGLTPCDKCAH